jgi:hypothetical protein
MSPSLEPLPTRHIRRVGRWLTVILCLLHGYVARHAMNPDGISYLEVSQGYLHGDASVNFYWGPLLSVLLAVARLLVPLGPYWEATVAHGVTLFTFFLSLLAFEWLLTEVLRMRRARTNPGLPDWVIVGLAYGSFAWVARWGIKVSILTPDMLVAAAVYAGVALLLRLQREPECPWAAPVLGAILGLGYLAKTIVLPVGLLILGTLLLALPWRWGWRRLIVAGTLLVLIAGPYVALLSLHKGRLTPGESGRLNYYWEVAHGPRPELLALVEDRSALPRRLLDALPVVALPARPGATYALWFDCSLWYDDLPGRVDLPRQTGAWVRALGDTVTLLRWTLAPLTAALLVLLGVSFLGRSGGAGSWLSAVAAGLRGTAPLLVPALGASLLYASTGVIEGRLAGPFVLLIFLAIALALPAGGASVCGYVGGLSLLLLALLGTLVFDGWSAAQEGIAPHPHWRVVERLRELGVRVGDGVGTIGSSYNAYWAHLAGTPVVAEIPKGRERGFWTATEEEQERACAALHQAGAVVVVAETVSAPPGWEQVAGTRFALRKLQ